MAYQLTTNLSMQNTSALHLANVAPQYRDRTDPTSVYEVHVELELRAGAAAPTPFAEYGRYTLIVRDGQSDLLRVRTAGEWISRAPISERLIVVRNGIATPTGAATFLAAYGGGNTAGLLNAALTSLKNLGIIEQATLAGTAP
jgi:hypothetical protein